MNTLHVVGRALLDGLSAQAAAHPRLRKNYNLHASEQEPCNRLLNAIQPGTYVAAHCHAETHKDETMVMVRGRMGVLAFDERGELVETVLLEAGGEQCSVTIPHGVFHSVVSLMAGTVFFEAKAGPYRPLQPAEKPVWAPAEGTPEAAAFLAQMRTLFSI